MKNNRYRMLQGAALIMAFLMAPVAFGAHAFEETHVITVDTDKVAGEIYNLWNVRVIPSPEQWAKKNQAKTIRKETHPEIDTIMNVRLLGGKMNKTCDWFKGVDATGEPICDFSGLYEILDHQSDAGFTPWIVLDNVPWGMVANAEPELYGQTAPPDDFNLWYKYVQKCTQALVDRYGVEKVSNWRFRVGTEPNLFPKHWKGTREEYFKHYDYTVAAVESVLPDPFIGPGNFLMLKGFQAANNNSDESWTFDILGHCVNGTNYYTGKVGTRISFYAQSCYARQGQPFAYENNMKAFLGERAKYPSLKALPHEIHEYGEIQAATQKGDFVPYIEWFAGLYAQTVDLAYQYGTQKIFNWGGVNEIQGKVVDCLVTMENSNRLDVTKSEEQKLNFGAIATEKEGRLYVLIYSHDTKVHGDGVNNINLTIKGDCLSKARSWTLTESLLDKNNGISIYEQYKDIEAAGIKPVGRFELDRVNRKYSKADQPKIREILKANRDKYDQMEKMKVVRFGEKVNLRGGEIELNLRFQGSGIRFIELSPL